LIAKRKERAGIFRQQYKDELKQMFGKKKDQKNDEGKDQNEGKQPVTTLK
jgi:hypothetical protein